MKKYPSKVSYILLSFVFLVFYSPIIPIWINNELNGKMIGTIGFLTLIFAFVLYLFFKTEYIIDNKELKINCGVFSYKPIAIEKIKEISRSKNIISSPAPSFDRIEIKYGKYNSVIISPKNEIHFVKDLIKINPSIKNNITE
jgi:hypothetical protein